MRGQRKFKAPGRVIPIWQRIQETVTDFVAPFSNRERLIYSLIILSFLFIVFAAPSRAYSEDEGKLFQIAPQQCKSDDAWLNSNLASGQPSVTDIAVNSLNNSNSASWQSTAGELVCSKYLTNPSHTISKPAISINFSTSDNGNIEAEEFSPSIDASSINYQPTQINGRKTIILPNALGIDLDPSLDNIFSVSLSTDNGKTWSVIHEFDGSLINLDSQPIEIAVPENLFIDTDRFATKIEAINNRDDINFLLDSITLTYQVSRSDDLKVDFKEESSTTQDLPVVARSDLHFKLSAKDPAEGIWQALSNKVKANVGDNSGPDVAATATIVDVEGNIIKEKPLDLTWEDTSLSNEITWEAIFPENTNQMEPENTN